MVFRYCSTVVSVFFKYFMKSTFGRNGRPKSIFVAIGLGLSQPKFKLRNSKDGTMNNVQLDARTSCQKCGWQSNRSRQRQSSHFYNCGRSCSHQLNNMN